MHQVSAPSVTAAKTARPRRDQFSATLPVMAITAVAAVFRLLHLGAKSLWLDEILSVSIARLDGPGFRNIVFSWEANMALYYALLRAWIHAGDSEFMLRLPSALASVATVPLVYLIGRRLFSQRVGLIAALLLAMNLFAIRYAQEARSYSLYVLLVVLACWFFIRAADRPTMGNWAWLAVTTTLAVYTHFFAALIVPVFWAAALVRRDFPWKGLFFSTLATCLASVPLGLFVLLKNKGQMDWVRPTNFRELFDFALLLSGRGGLVLLFACLACLVSACVVTLKTFRAEPRFDGEDGKFAYAVVCAWLLVPPILTAGISLVKPMFVGRFLILCLPAFVLLVAVGLSQIRPRWLMAAAVVVLVCLSVRPVFDYYQTRFDPPDQDWRAVVQYVLGQVRPGDAILFYHPLARLPSAYYRVRLHTAIELPVPVPTRAAARV